MARRWQEAYGLKILDGIGSTEILHIYCSNTETAYRPGSSGTPVPGYDLELRDEAGGPVPQGEVGDLYVRGGSSLAGYWHHRERTARTLLGEWFATGDRYRVDDDGFWWYEGRADDMIKVGGLWVSPIEIENILTEHPDVLEAAVVGVEVEGLTRIRAHVICREGVKGDDTLVAVLVESCKAGSSATSTRTSSSSPTSCPRPSPGRSSASPSEPRADPATSRSPFPGARCSSRRSSSLNIS